MHDHPISLIPGPVSVPRKVREIWLTDFGSSDLEDDFFALYAENQALVQELLGTRETVVISSGEAMSILWGGLKSALAPGDRLLAISSGLFGEGFAEMAQVLGFETELVSFPFNSIPDPDTVRKIVKTFRPQLITAVHCETPSGTLTPNLKVYGEMAREVDALFLVDFVSSGAGAPIDVDENLIDIGLLGSQKVLSLPPSLSISTISERAWKVFEHTSYSGYDAYLPWRNIPESRALPYTNDWHYNAALNLALKTFKAEGWQNVYRRHSDVATLCRNAAKTMGLSLYPISEDICSPTVSAFLVPDGWSWDNWNSALRAKGVLVGGNYGSLAGKVFRIGHMGSQADKDKVQTAMNIIKDVLESR